MRKFLILFVFLLMPFITFAESRYINYDYDVIDNSNFDLLTGQINNNIDYVVTSRIFINDKTIYFNPDVFHHLLLWDKNNSYVGYYNSSGSNVINSKYLGKVSNNLVLGDSIKSIAFVVYKNAVKEYTYNNNKYSWNTIINPSRNMYINDNFNLNLISSSDLVVLDTQAVVNTNNYLQYFYNSGSLTNADIYITKTSNIDYLAKSYYKVNDLNYNSLVYENGNYKLNYNVDKVLDDKGYKDFLDVDYGINYKVNDLIKNTTVGCGNYLCVNKIVNKVVLDGDLYENWLYYGSTADTLSFKIDVSNVASNGGVISTNFSQSSYGVNNEGVYLMNQGIIFTIYKNKFIGFDNSWIGNKRIEEFKKWLQLNNQVCFYEYEVKNSNNITLTGFYDVFDLNTSYTSLDYILIYKPIDFLGYNNINNYQFKLENYNVDTMNDLEDTANIDTLFTSVDPKYFYLGVEKGSYTLDSAMQTIDGLNLYYETKPTKLQELADLYDNNYITACTVEAYNNELSFNNGYMFYIVDSQLINLPNTYLINYNQNNQIIWNTLESINLVVLKNSANNIFSNNLSFDMQLENGFKFTNYLPYNSNYNNNLIPVDFPDEYLTEMFINQKSYSTNLTSGSLNLLGASYLDPDYKPYIKKNVDQNISTFLSKFGFDNTFSKVIFAISIMTGISLILFILKMSKSIIILSISVLFIVLVYVGFISVWLLMLMGIVVFGYFLLTLKSNTIN